MKKLTTVILLLACAITTQAQWGMGGSKIIQKSGDLKPLNGQSLAAVEYDYSNVKVGAYNSEAEFVDKKVEEYNKKSPGKGDTWKKGWIGARKERYEPKFEELFNEKMKKSGMQISKTSPNAKFKLIVKTTFIEPGFNVGMMKKPAYVNFEFTIVENAAPTNIVAELYLNNVIGSQAMGFDFDTSSRIAEAYAKGGKMLGDYIVKDLAGKIKH